MAEPLISIIIPVYNTAPYLDTCLNSLRNQTFAAWEALCIDDGSTDNSLEILRRYAETDVRFRVFEQANAGVSTARNRGIKEARGRYLTMVDSDDELPPDALAHLAAPVQENENLDFVIGNMLWLKEVEGKLVPLPFKPLLYGASKTGLIEDRVYLAQYTPGIPSAKLYRKALLDEHGIMYDPELHIGEDHELTLRFLLYCKQAYVMPDIVYHYMIRQSSTMGRFRAGQLPLEYYIAFPSFSVRMAADLPKEMPRSVKREYAQVLLFYYLRDLLRCLLALWDTQPKNAIRLLFAVWKAKLAASWHLRGTRLSTAYKLVSRYEPNLFMLFDQRKRRFRRELKSHPLIAPFVAIRRFLKSIFGKAE